MSEAETAVPQAPVTNRRVLKIAIPIVLSNITVPLLGVVDTGVIGQLGEAAPIGAVGLGAIVLSAIYWVFGFLRMGTVGLVGQALGRGDHAEVIALLMRVLMIALCGGLLLICLQVPLFLAVFQVTPASAEVETLARSYMEIRIWSSPAAIAVFGLNGWLIAQERTRAVLALQVWMNGLNIVLDLVFVLGLGWGVEGVAMATAIAEISGLILALWICRSAFSGSVWRDMSRVFDRVKLKRMALVNTDILIRSLAIEGMFVSFMIFGADFGDVTLAANQILFQFVQAAAYGLDGFAFAAEALVAQAVGSRSLVRLRQSVLITSGWGLVCVSLATVLFALYGGAMIDLMTTEPNVRLAARAHLWWMVAVPLVGLSAWMLDGVFIGATRTRDMRNMMVLSAAFYFAAVYTLVPIWGNHGLWAAMNISFAVRGISLAFRYPALERASV